MNAVGVLTPELAALFDYIEGLQFWIKDIEGRFLWVNIPFLLNYGLKGRDEVIGRTDYDLSDPSFANHFRLDDEKVLKGMPITSRVELVGRFNHTALWSMTSKVPLHDADGRVVGTAGVTIPLREQTAVPPEAPLSAAIQLISRRFSEPLANEVLARACGMSVRVFLRQFAATYHTSPHTYLRQLRVRMSCTRLVFSHRTIAEVASEFGFADQSHFSKEFKRLMGETPRSYRQRYQRTVAD